MTLIRLTLGRTRKVITTHHELNAPLPAGLPDFLKTVTSTTPWDEGTDILSFSHVASMPSIGS